MPVCGHLHAAADAVSTVLHEIHSPSTIASANEIAQTKFRIGFIAVQVSCVAPALSFFLGADVLRSCSDEAPNFIALSGETLICSGSHLNVAMFDYCQTLFLAFESKTVDFGAGGQREDYESVRFRLRLFAPTLQLSHHGERKTSV